MADQRRRGGRGRSGRGGRIPRKGDAQAAQASEETFVSFPLDVSGPIRVPSTLDEEAVAAALRTAAERESRQIAALRGLAEGGGDAALQTLLGEAESHQAALAQLARELDAELPPGSPANGEAGVDPSELVARQRLARLSWGVLQRAAYIAGDRRIDRAVKPVLADKARHAEVLEEWAERAAGRALAREPEY